MTLEIPLENVTIELVQTLEPIDHICFQDSFSLVSADRFDYIVPEIATFSIRSGKKVLIMAHPETSKEILELYLRGTVLAILLYQKGVFCMHASSVLSKNKVILFAGNSGSGKSTTAYILHKAGYPCLNDDVTPIYCTQSAIETRSLTSEIKIDKVLLSDDSTPYRAVPSQEHKVFFPIAAKKDPISIHCMYVFRWGEHFAITEITGSEKLNILLQHVFRNEYLQSFPDLQQKFFNEFVQFIGNIPIYLVTKAKDRDPQKVVELLIQHFEQ